MQKSATWSQNAFYSASSVPAVSNWANSHTSHRVKLLLSILDSSSSKTLWTTCKEQPRSTGSISTSLTMLSSGETRQTLWQTLTGSETSSAHSLIKGGKKWLKIKIGREATSSQWCSTMTCSEIKRTTSLTNVSPSWLRQPWHPLRLSTARSTIWLKTPNNSLRWELIWNPRLNVISKTSLDKTGQR